MQKKFIDVARVLNELPDDLPYKSSVKRVLIQAPEADVVEVKRGKWILNKRDRQRFGKVRNPEDYEHYCSCCNEEALCNYGDDSGSWWYLSDYCPNCGARMDGDT